jgi:hypothetical protein
MTKDEALKMANKTPLKDLLRDVPKDGRDMYEHSPTSHHNIPYGRLIHEALAEIERLEAINACKEALEQPAQEPVAKCLMDNEGNITEFLAYKYKHYDNPDDVKLVSLYTHPNQDVTDINVGEIPQSIEWQGLTDDEIARLVLINEVDKSGDTGFAKLIEQALKAKNI